MAVFHCECGARYSFPDDKAGRKARCGKCGRESVLEDHTAPIPFVEEPDDRPTPPSIDQGRIVAPPGSPAAAGIYLGDVRGSGYLPGESAGSFIRSTLLFPAGPENLVTFLVIGAVMTLTRFMSVGGPFLLLCMPVVLLAWYMWFAVYKLEVIESATAAERDIPGLNFGVDIISDGIYPFGRWVASWGFAYTPLIILLGVAVATEQVDPLKLGMALSGGMPDVYTLLNSGEVQRAFVVLAGVGWLLWPVAILAAMLHGVDSLIRVDRILLTIMRTWPSYVLPVLMLILTSGVAFLVNAAIASMVGTGAPAQMLVRLTVLLLAKVYLDVVLMRFIGFYYFQSREEFEDVWGDVD